MGPFQVLTISQVLYSTPFNSIPNPGEDGLCYSHKGDETDWGAGHMYLSLDFLSFWPRTEALKDGLSYLSHHPELRGHVHISLAETSVDSR